MGGHGGGHARIGAHRRALGLTLLIETEASNVVDTPEKALSLLRTAGPQTLRIVMDCANLFHVGDAHAERVRPVMGHAFDVLGQHIVLAHGKDLYAGDGIEFAATGRGIVDYPYFLERLSGIGYQEDMILHGIYDPKEIGRAVAFMQPLVAGYAGA